MVIMSEIFSFGKFLTYALFINDNCSCGVFDLGIAWILRKMYCDIYRQQPFLP